MANPLATLIRRTTRMTLCVLAGAASLALAPEPSPVPIRWEVSVEFGPMRITKLDVPGKGMRAYFYFAYKATNNSSEDLLFAPSFDMVGADGRILRAGRDVPATVTKLLLDRAGNPFIQDQISVIGPLLKGPENAKDGLVVFSADSLSPGELALFAAGFSGETATVTPPGTNDRVILRKTRMIRFGDAGDLTARGERPLDTVESRWIMR